MNFAVPIRQNARIEPDSGLCPAAPFGRSVAIGTIGGVGMWSVPVALPAVQAEFGVDRAAASLPYTLTMIGFAFSGVLLGRLVDRFGIFACRSSAARS